MFHQIFTIHGRTDHNFYTPLVFFLLPNKESQTYGRLFKHTVDECLKYGQNFSPTNIFCDFEQAIHIGVSSVWPSASIKGCRFHLAQSWWKKIQELGLTSAYKENNSEIRKVRKAIFGLPVLDPGEIGDSFAEDFCSRMPNDK